MMKQDAVKDDRLCPGAANWQSWPNNIVWHPTSADTWQTGQNIHRSCLWPILCILWKHDVIHETKYIMITFALPSEDQATANSTMYRKFGEICTRFWGIQSGRHTDKQTQMRADDNNSHP